MSGWIKSHQALRNHPKKDHLTELLFNGTTPNDVADMAAVGLLHHLWWWALDYAPDGDLAKFSDRQIAKACGWHGDATLLMHALVESGFVEKKPRTIHDWDEYGGALLVQRQANRDRAKAHYEQSKDSLRADYAESKGPEKKELREKKVLKRDGPVDNSTIRPVAPPKDPVCWRCQHVISGDEILDDLTVVSNRGIRHKDCPPGVTT